MQHCRPRKILHVDPILGSDHQLCVREIGSLSEMIKVVMADTKDLNLLRLDTLPLQNIFHASFWAEQYAARAKVDGHASIPKHELAAMANKVAGVHHVTTRPIKHGIVVIRHR